MVHQINLDESSMREETPNEHTAVRQLEMILHHEETRAAVVVQHQATATAVEDPQDFISTMLNEQIQENHDLVNGLTNLQEAHVHDAATAVEAIIGEVATNKSHSIMNATFQDRSRPHDDNEALSYKRRRTEAAHEETTTLRTNTGNTMYGNEGHVQQQEQPYLQQVDVGQNNAVHEKNLEQQQIQMTNVANHRNQNTDGVIHQAQLLPQQALNNVQNSQNQNQANNTSAIYHRVQHRQKSQQQQQVSTAQVPVQMQQNVYIQPLPTMDQNQMQMNAAETVGHLNLPVFTYPQNGQSFPSLARQEQLGAIGNGDENNGPSQASTNHTGQSKEGEDGALTRVSTPLTITGELADKNLPWNDTNWVSSGLSDMVRGAREQMNVLLQRRRMVGDELANAQIALEVAQQKVEMAHKNIKFTDDAIQRSTESLTDALLQEPTHWNAMYHKLLRYKEDHGTIEVKKIDETAKKPNVDGEENNPEETSENGWTAAEHAKLNSWISKVRLAAKKTGSNPDVIEPYKIIALNRLDFKWDPREVYWSNRLEEFKQYLAAQPADQKHKMPNRKTPLGIWCDGVIMEYGKFKAGTKPCYITEKRIKLLTDAGFIFEKRNAGWMSQYNKVKEFHSVHGHCSISSTHKEKAMHRWLSKQRRKYKNLLQKQKPDLTEEQVKLLDEIDFFDEFHPEASSKKKKKKKKKKKRVEEKSEETAKDIEVVKGSESKEQSESSGTQLQESILANVEQIIAEPLNQLPTINHQAEDLNDIIANKEVQHEKSDEAYGVTMI